MTWQELKDAFREFGKIVRADVPHDSSVSEKVIGADVLILLYVDE